MSDEGFKEVRGLGGHGDIQADQKQLMNDIAKALDEGFNGKDCPASERRVGFVLLTANFGQIDGGRVNYISNGDRPQMIEMMEELLGRFKKEKR